MGYKEFLYTICWFIIYHVIVNPFAFERTISEPFCLGNALNLTCEVVYDTFIRNLG